MTSRTQRPNSKLLLRESNFGGICQSYTAGNLPPLPPAPSKDSAAPRQRVFSDSSPIERSRGHPPSTRPPDEWTDYTDGQWNLLLLTNEDSLSTDRYAEPLLLSPEVDITRHLAAAGRFQWVAPPPVVQDLQASFLAKESDQADDDTTENLIDFDTDEQTLVKRF